MKDAAWDTAAPYRHVISGYNLSDKQKMHWERILRAVVHGFISQEGTATFLTTPRI